MDRLKLLSFALLAAVLLAFGSSDARMEPIARGAAAASDAGASTLSPAAVESAADAEGSPQPFDFGRYGVLRLRLQDSGVVTADTLFTRLNSAGAVHGSGHKAPRTLSGTVADDPTSVVRLTTTTRWVAGFVQTRGRMLLVGPDDYDHPTRILVGEPQPAPAGVRAVGDGPRASSAEPAAAADPIPTPTVTPPTPLPTLTPTTVGTAVPSPSPSAPPSPFPISVWPTSPAPFPAPAVTAPAVAAGIYNCRVVRCNVVTVKVILDADFTYTTKYGSGCEDRQVAALNLVDGIWMRAETRIHFVTAQVNCRTQQAPLTAGISTGAMLDKLRNAWDNTGANRTIVHLAVGYDFGVADPDDAIGRAYQAGAPNATDGGACGRLHPDDAAGADVPEVLSHRIRVEATPSAGPIRASVLAEPVDVPDVRCAYGFSLHQAVRRPNTNYGTTDPLTLLLLSAKIFAHEIGHNFSADHEPSASCPAARTGTLMCGELQDAGPNVFSFTAAKRIREWAESKDGSITGT